MNNKEFWFFLFSLGVLMFNWPFLDIFNMILPYYFFGAWALFILVVFAVADGEKGEKDRNA